MFDMFRFIPALNGNEKGTLFFIGNGFDLHHGLKTTYQDFHDWLLKYNYYDVVDSMEKMFPSLNEGKPLLWKDFEKALGVCNPMKIHEVFFQGYDDGGFDEEKQTRVARRIGQTLSRIPELLREWLTKSIDLDKIDRVFENLSNQSLYLTFNYTKLLEEVYNISKNKILHIHNKIDDREPLITGHNAGFNEDIFENDNINVEYSQKYIAKEINNLRKPVAKIIESHSSFFDSLANITHVVVFGQSLSQIDRSYFTEVFHHVQDNAKWFFVCYDEIAKAHYSYIVEGYNERLKKTYGARRYHKKMMVENCEYIKM